MSDEEKREASKNICEQLQEIIEIKKPETLVLYNPLSDEVDISSLEKWFSHRGHVITVGQDGLFEAFKNSKQTLAIIPGRAFTEDGKRIGRGSGYYDIFLSTHSHIESLWVCFRCQIFENIPEDPWDKRVNMVVFAWNTIE